MHKMYKGPNALQYFYSIMVTNVGRPLMWPSSGWFLWQQEYNYN